jgi:pseudouridine synthase
MNPRINKYLVMVGLADSRRKADELIKQGAVTVNDKVVSDMSYRVESEDIVKANGLEGSSREDIYIAYNKPRGEICSHKSYGNDKTIFDSLPESFSKLKIAGRLDRDSEGLIILSSDGEFINKVSHPSMNKSKTYLVITKESISDSDIEKLNKGIKLEDGLSKLKVARNGDKALKIVMSEGKNRQIRRTLYAIKKDVIKLQRVRIANYSNSRLEPREYVFIKPEEVL